MLLTNYPFPQKNPALVAHGMQQLKSIDLTYYLIDKLIFLMAFATDQLYTKSFKEFYEQSSSIWIKRQYEKTYEVIKKFDTIVIDIITFYFQKIDGALGHVDVKQRMGGWQIAWLFFIENLPDEVLVDQAKLAAITELSLHANIYYTHYFDTTFNHLGFEVYEGKIRQVTEQAKRLWSANISQTYNVSARKPCPVNIFEAEMASKIMSLLRDMNNEFFYYEKFFQLEVNALMYYRQQQKMLRPLDLTLILKSGYQMDCGFPGVLPAHHHIIWVGTEMPEIYKLELARATQLNPHFQHFLWWCPDLLPDDARFRMQAYAQQFRITLKNVLDYRFENDVAIKTYLVKGDYARFSDALRLEEAFAGIYTDTDTRYKKPFPSLAELEKSLSQHYGIFTSAEAPNIGISNSILVRAYGCPIMRACRATLRSNFEGNFDANLIPKDQNLIGHSERDVQVLHETGQFVIARAIMQEKFNITDLTEYNLRKVCGVQFNSFIFTRVFPKILDMRVDLTWTVRGRNIFQLREYITRRSIDAIKFKYCKQRLFDNAIKFTFCK